MNAWTKSSYSGSHDCVEIAQDADMAGIRDSKDSDGPALWFPEQAFTEFLTGIKADEFTR